jgi:uncharacterized protein YbaP (TraB family)
VQELLAARTRAFLVLGVGHLVGPGNLLELLDAERIAVRRDR